MEQNNPVVSFNNFKVDSNTKNKLITKLRNTPELEDIQNYLINNPELLNHLIKINIFQNQNNERNEEELINNIVSQVRNIYNKISERSEINQINSLNNNDGYGNETGIELTNRKKGGKTNKKKRIKKYSKNINRNTSRYNKKTLRKKRKQKITM